MTAFHVLCHVSSKAIRSWINLHGIRKPQSIGTCYDDRHGASQTWQSPLIILTRNACRDVACDDRVSRNTYLSAVYFWENRQEVSFWISSVQPTRLLYQNARMLLPTMSQMLVLLDTLMHRSLAAPASLGNLSNALSSPPTPGFALREKVNYPGQPDFDASSMLLLTCQMLYDYSRNPWYVSAFNSEQSDSNICIAITNVLHPTERHGLLQNRHAMWALWRAAMQQATYDDLRAGVFGLQVMTGPQWTDVAIMTYSRFPEPHNPVAAADDRTADLASRSNDPPSIMRTVLPPPNSSTNGSAVSFTANSSVGTSPYPVVLRQAGAGNLDFVKVFSTICEAMIQRASLPRRPLANRWTYNCQATGYKISLQPLRRWSPYAAVMGGLANLLKAMIEARRNTETAFDVLSGTGEVLLQGVLFDGRAAEAGAGLSFA